MNNTQKIYFSNIFEWFDFTLFLFFSVPIGLCFFDQKSSTVAALYSFSVFAVSYIVRPLGSFLFSYIADKTSALNALRYTMLALTIPSAIIGFLPSYDKIGVFSSFILIILRCLQGVAAGGELPCLAVFAFESSPDSKYKNVWCAITNIGGMIGVLLASLSAFTLYYFFSVESINNWAWRIPFILTIPFSILILNLRWKVSEGVKLTSKNSLDKEKESIKIILKMSAVISFMQVSFHVIFMWLPSYLEVYLLLPSPFVKLLNTSSLVLSVLATVASAFIGSGEKAHRMVFFSALLCAIAAIPLFALINTKNHFLVYFSVISFVFILGLAQGNYIYVLTSSFAGKNKNKLIALVYSIPTAVLGGSVSFFCGYFVFILKMNYFPAFYLSFFSVALCFSFLSSENSDNKCNAR